MSKLVRLTLAGLALSLTPALAPSPALAQTDLPAQTLQQATAMTAEQFVAAAVPSNLFEIRSSELALQHATTAPVQQFAQQMIADHTAAGERLQAVLAQSGSTAAPPMSLDPPHQAMMTQLENASAETFDTTYVNLQLQAHEQAVLLFSSYASSGDDPALRAFAAETLPVLQHHLSEILALAGRT
jgi:putative membrane protein